ncbi:hypothetical protein AtubIFM61612_008305 [Aspergillus tubingensis]|nr:hypothetical protein AtubIFM61612_008305 [Aspergillus tubingensis]
MRYCPDRLPSIAPAKNEDIDVVLDLGNSTLKELMDTLHSHHSQFFIKHRETLYIRTARGKVRIDFKVIPADSLTPREVFTMGQMRFDWLCYSIREKESQSLWGKLGG